MTRAPGSSLPLLLTGLGWLVLSALLGVAILIGIVRGTPLPGALRSIHVHGAVVGGLLQMLLGGLLMASPDVRTGRNFSAFRYLLYNAATIGLLAGFGLRDHHVIAMAGVAVVAALALSARDIWRFMRRYRDPLHGFYYGFALLALAGGLTAAEGLAFHLVQQWQGHARLAHIHLSVSAFMILLFVGLTQQTLPTIVQKAIHSPLLSVLVLILLPGGTAGLLTGFWLSSVHVQLATGCVLLAGIALHAYNQFRTWLDAGQPGTCASDHVVAASFFLLLTAMMGLALGVNSLWSPPALPYGTLHIVAYTHAAFIGFLLQGSLGSLSFFLPTWLSSRAASGKKRAWYLDRLMQVMNRWRAPQLFSISGGTLGLAFVASLTWTMPLGSSLIHAITWGSAALLTVGLALFCGKVAQLFTSRADDRHE